MNLTDQSKKKILIVLVVLLSILLVAIGVLIYKQIDSAKKDAKANTENASATVLPSVTASTSAIASVTASASASSTAVASNDLIQAKQVATSFMGAKRDRSLGEAKPYMTDELYNSTDQDSFAGVSSPSMSESEITNATTKEDGKVFLINIRSYWLLQGEDAGTVDYTIEVVKNNNSFLVNKFDQN